jgi:hypothetical protein
MHGALAEGRGLKVPPAVSQCLRGCGQGRAWFDGYIVGQGVRWRALCGTDVKCPSASLGARFSPHNPSVTYT